MPLNKSEELNLRKWNAVTRTEFLQKIFGNTHAGFQSECMLRIQLLSHDDLIEILSAAMHQLFEAITLLAEPVCNNRFLTHGQVLVIDHFAERVCPLLKNGQIDRSEEHTSELQSPSNLLS